DALSDFIKKANITHRECNLYTPVETGNDCQCGQDKKWHDDRNLKKSDSATWDMKTHTKKYDCNSFGEIKFEGFRNETANSQYIRVDPETKREDLWTIMTNYWKLPFPELLISITGGAKRFDPTDKHQQIFKRVLMNAATTTGAWIITGGMGTGVMKIVGEAVRDHILTKGTTDKKIVALGIATWGCVANRKSLVGHDQGLWPATYRSADLGNRKETGDEPEVLLDHNHTHFILVDDGTINKYGVEIELVAELEKYISKRKSDTGLVEKLSVPMVKIVVEGGVNTMETVWKSVTANIPVLVLKGTGRAADFIAYGYRLQKQNSKKGKIKFLEKLKKKAESVFQWKDKDKKENEIKNCVDKLINILDKERRLINIFDINEADTKDIDRAILDALLKANESNSEAQLTLALAWNRSDIAKEKIITNKNRNQWKKKEDLLYHAMFTALVQDRVDFVQLFLDCGVSFSKFLSIDTLWNLYAYPLFNHSDSIAQLLKELIRYIKQSWAAYLCFRQPKNFHTEPDLLASVGKIIVHLLKEESMNLYRDKNFSVKDVKPELKWLPGNHMEKKKAEENTSETNKWDFEQPEKELFLWAVLFNREDMARMFWKMSKNHIAGALVACALLKRLATKADDNEELELKDKLLKHSKKYEDLATDVLGECYRKDKQLSHQLIVRQIKNYGNATLLTLAHVNELMNFMGHTCCQTKLNLIWKGRMATSTPILLILGSIILPILTLPIKFPSNQVQDEEQTKERICRNQVGPDTQEEDQKEKASSKSKTCLNKHNVVVSFVHGLWYFYSAPITVFIFNAISYLSFLGIFSYFVLTDLYPGKPSILEYITWGWTGTMLIEEFRQIVDLMFFMMIFAIFLLSFGVAYQANLFPNSEPNWNLLKNVVYMPYWQMYGQLFLENMEGKPEDNCIKNETQWRALGGYGRCPAENALVPLLGAVYLVLTNILLINLLIAMFSYTFQKVQVQSENVWRFYRFSLVHEYYDRPFLCPPFIIFNHLFRLVRYVCHRCGYDIWKSSNEFRLKLVEKEDNRLTLFEKGEMEVYLSSSQRQQLDSVEKKVTTTHERLEIVMDDLNNIKQFIKDLDKRKGKLTENLDDINEPVKPQENLAKQMDSASDVSPPSNFIKVQTDVKNDTREEMQMHPNEPGNQMMAEMIQILKQIRRTQEQNIRAFHLEISDNVLSEA
ncbi:hypothetical protein ACJMK2_033729, partial [Sinanodonta woodiana]